MSGRWKTAEIDSSAENARGGNLSVEPLKIWFLVLAAAVFAPHVAAQYSERSSLHGSGAADVDVSGRSVKDPRVRAIHTSDALDPNLAGGTAWLVKRDPFLAYQIGRNLNMREFRLRDGTFSAVISGLGGPMVDGKTAKITTNNQTSCLGCHNLPPGTPGGGTNFHKDSGFGRNAPHYFGAGLVEMLALQIRRQILEHIDLDLDGWVSAAEAAAAGPDALVSTTPGGPLVNFGNCQLSGGAVGKPQMNRMIRVWYGKETTDQTGAHTVKIVPGATSIDGINTTHFNFELVVWGWGQRAPPSALNPTNRAFFWDPMNTHTGLLSHDPSTTNDPDGDGVSDATLVGAEQFPATHRAPDKGLVVDPLGFSRDDPDGDGYLTEISEGDLDLAEWFMLNAPRPAFAGDEASYNRGLRAMRALSCTSCHTPDWDILPYDGTHAGDRRAFDFGAVWNAERSQLEGRLTRLVDVHGELSVPRRDGFRVRGLFSDLCHHEMGEGFAELAFDGNRNTVWRTAPLWGVGSGFPWGHDGESLSLDHVIRRHGGEAAKSGAAYAAASDEVREELLSFLSSLVLYDIESLPADIDGDGIIAPHFLVAGMDTGTERFNAEWLFDVPVQIQGMVLNNDNELVRSNAAINFREAYALDLPLRKDTDLDGWPDDWDHAPTVVGYKDGEH